MKKYTTEEAKNVPIFRQGRHTAVHMGLTTLLPGEILEIEIGKDWISKTPPHSMVSRFAKKHKWKLVTGKSRDKKFYLVKRIS
jgi:hypothetical protein